jgi:hypothetical protein
MSKTNDFFRPGQTTQWDFLTFRTFLEYRELCTISNIREWSPDFQEWITKYVEPTYTENTFWMEQIEYWWGRLSGEYELHGMTGSQISHWLLMAHGMHTVPIEAMKSDELVKVLKKSAKSFHPHIWPYSSKWERLVEKKEIAEEGTNQEKKNTPKSTPKFTKVEMALFALSKEPGLSVRSIARKVNCSHTLLLGSDLFIRKWKEFHPEPLKGHKEKNGHIEAYQNDEN